MNDSVEPVDLSPTRAELMARVRARGLHIRARRRVMTTAVTALLVIAIAAPAIALGTRSPSQRSITPATTPATRPPATTGDFRMALVTGVRPTQPAVHLGDRCTVSVDGKTCYVIGRTLVTARDVRSASVAYDDTDGWTITIDIDHAALARLAAPVGHQAAIIVDQRVVSAPVINPGISGTEVTISGTSFTRARAVAIATKILGHPPAHIDAGPDLTSSISLPGNRFTAGTEVHGTLTIFDNTTKPISLSLDRHGCRIPWGVVLTNASVPPDMAFAAPCIGGAIVLTPGASTFPFTLSTTYLDCTNTQPPPTGARACLPGGLIPPLPAGAYTAVLFGGSGMPDPPAVPITLVAAP